MQVRGDLADWSKPLHTYTCRHFPRVSRKSDMTIAVISLRMPSRRSTHAMCKLYLRGYDKHTLPFFAKSNHNGQAKVTELKNEKFLYPALRFIITPPHGVRKNNRIIFLGISRILHHLAKKIRFHKTEPISLDSPWSRVVFHS